MLDKIFDYLRFALYALLAVIVFFLFQTWQKEHQAQLNQTATTQQTSAIPADGHIPDVVNTQPAAQHTTAQPVQTEPTIPSPQTGKIVNVKTDLLDVNIDTHGGDIVGVKLLKYAESLENKSPVVLQNNDAATRYLAESGLLSKTGPDTTSGQALYIAEKSTYSLDPHTNEVTVKLNWQNNGLKVTKYFTFSRGSYEIKVGYDVNNQTSAPWTGNLYTQLLRTDSPPENGGGFMNLAVYFGAAIHTQQKAFQKITFKEMREGNINISTKDGWAAMVQHYFISAWVPPQNNVSTYYSRVTSSGLYTIGMIGPEISVPPNATLSTQAKLYTGPSIADLLEKTASGLKLTIDYGWFWFISEIIFWLMQKIYDVVGNWGWSIVLVTIIIKLLFYKLSAKSYRSMSGLKKLQPRIEALKERFGNDKQKMTQATLDLYRQEKVNPMSGCLPILIQIPVFIALYWVLVESVQLRQAPFILWIHDLSRHDPYYILPVLMGISMFLQQRLNPPPPDPMQAKVMMLMPIIFTVMFANFPAGLLLYWFVNNMLSYLQQWYVMHKLDKEGNGKKSNK